MRRGGGGVAAAAPAREGRSALARGCQLLWRLHGDDDRAVLTRERADAAAGCARARRRCGRRRCASHQSFAPRAPRALSCAPPRAFQTGGRRGGGGCPPACARDGLPGPRDSSGRRVACLNTTKARRPRHFSPRSHRAAARTRTAARAPQLLPHTAPRAAGRQAGCCWLHRFAAVSRRKPPPPPSRRRPPVRMRIRCRRAARARAMRGARRAATADTFSA